MNYVLLLLLIVLVSHSVIGQRLNVSLDKDMLNMTSNDSILYKFYLSEPSKTTIKFTNIFGGKEILFEKGEKRNKGWHVINIKSDSIKKLTDNPTSGVYYITVIAAAEGRKATQYNSFESPWGEPVVVTNLRYDSTTGRIHYSLPRTSMVKLRIGFPDGSLIRTITNAEPQHEGNYSVNWDGFDQTKAISAKLFSGLEAKVIAYALPKTAFILYNPAFPINNNALPSYPENFEKYALHPFAKIGWKNCVDLSLDFKVISNADDTFSFEFQKQSDQFNKYYSAENEIYISVNGQYVVENPNVVVPGKYTIAFPGVPSGKQIVIVNLILPDNRISIGLKEVIVL
jgi:hypothetical protein